MTDEQIKLNAEVYANTLRIGGLGNSPKLIAIVSFEEGAHSRDEEINELQKENLYMESLLSMHRKMTGEYELKLQKLRNPWRDAKNNPPEREIGNKICYTFLDTAIDGVHTQRYYHFAEFKKYGFGKKGWLDEDGNHVLVEIADYWMPIPELPKGDEK